MNDKFFKGGMAKVAQLGEHIKHVARYWFIARNGIKSNLVFLDWWINPLICLQCI